MKAFVFLAVAVVLLYITTTVLLLIGSHFGKQNSLVFPYVSKQIVATEYPGVYRSEGVYQCLGNDTISGYSVYYFIHKPNSVIAREWSDSVANLDYLREHSPKELSQWFDIYMCHTIKSSLEKAPDRSYFNIMNSPGAFTFYQLDFRKKEMIKIKQFDYAPLVNIKIWNRWFTHFLEENAVKKEGEMKESTATWNQNSSMLTDYSLDNLKSEETIRLIEWFDIPKLLDANPLSDDNVGVYFEGAYQLISYKKYNEARLILSAITQKYPYPNRRDFLLELKTEKKATDKEY